MNFGTKGCMYNCGDECTGECIKVETKTKKVECETISIKTAIVVEEGTPEIVIPKKIRKEVEKLLIEELKNSKQ